MAEKMRLALSLGREITDEKLTFARQLGIADVQLHRPDLPGEGRWEFRDLVLVRSRCEDAGLRLAAIESTPVEFYMKAMLGEPGRDEQIENYQETIRNMGRAGIPVLGYAWHPDLVWRTSSTTRDRGDAMVTSFDSELVKNAPLTFGREFTEEEMWDNYTYFLKAVAPVAEESGVRLALHPCDPPVPSIGGMPRIHRSFESFKRVVEIYDSPANGLDFCQGTWSEMGPDVLEAIRYFGSRDRIVYVHFRSVIGHVPRFRETFINTGNVNMLEAMRTYKEVGFTGFFLDDHVPQLSNDTPGRHVSHAYALGYIQALLDSV